MRMPVVLSVLAVLLAACGGTIQPASQPTAAYARWGHSTARPNSGPCHAATS